MAVTSGTISAGTTSLIKKGGTYVPVDGSIGTYYDTITVEQSDGTVVNRSVLVLGDAEDTAKVQNVVASRANTDQHAALVRLDSDMSDILKSLLQEFRLFSTRFEEAFDTKISQKDML